MCAGLKSISVSPSGALAGREKSLSLHDIVKFIAHAGVAYTPPHENSLMAVCVGRTHEHSHEDQFAKRPTQGLLDRFLVFERSLGLHRVSVCIRVVAEKNGRDDSPSWHMAHRSAKIPSQ
jgi:hypothetical protein